MNPLNILELTVRTFMGFTEKTTVLMTVLSVLLSQKSVNTLSLSLALYRQTLLLSITRWSSSLVIKPASIKVTVAIAAAEALFDTANQSASSATSGEDSLICLPVFSLPQLCFHHPIVIFFIRGVFYSSKVEAACFLTCSEFSLVSLFDIFVAVISTLAIYLLRSAL